ncbi:MAG: ethylbenzene dehydrogenase-related protein [Planctomycetota bacterium]
MRAIPCLLLLLACGDATSPTGPAARPAGAPNAKPTRIEVRSLPSEIQKVQMDGSASDAAWQQAREYKLALDGAGPTEATLRVAMNERYVLFFLVWRDEKPTRRCVSVLGEDERWKRINEEDGVLFFFPPLEAQEGFDLATYRTPTGFAYEGPKGFADVWYWGAQTTDPYERARDHWLRPKLRLRGDAQPVESDNIVNWNVLAERPAGVPKRIDPRTYDWKLPFANAQALDDERYGTLDLKRNIGWRVSSVIHRRIRGSRGDVLVQSKWAGGAWFVEIARARETGQRDDHPIGAPGTSTVFALGIYDGTGRGTEVGQYGVEAAFSAPIELVFPLVSDG